MNLLPLLMKKLIEIRIFVRGTKDVNKHPAFVVRSKLEGFLRVTQAELLEAFGVKTPSKLTVTLRKAIAVVARVNKGVDSYKTIGEKAETLIKRLHPIYVEQLKSFQLESSRRAEREALETSRKAEREALQKRFTALSRGKALPDGTSDEQLMKLVSDLRSDLVDKTTDLMKEVNEPALRHPDIAHLSDVNLVAIKARLDARFKELHAVRPRSFAEQFAQRNAVQ